MLQLVVGSFFGPLGVILITLFVVVSQIAIFRGRIPLKYAINTNQLLVGFLGTYTAILLLVFTNQYTIPISIIMALVAYSIFQYQSELKERLEKEQVNLPASRSAE